MRRKNRLVIVASLCAMSLLIVGALQAQESEKRVQMKDLPPAVRKTVEEQSKGATIRGLSKEIEAGKTYYEAELTVQGHGKDVLIDSAGKVVEIEEEVQLASLPPAVKKTIEKSAAGGKIGKIESITKNGNLVAYEAQLVKAGKKSEVKVAPDGKVIAPRKKEAKP